MAKGSSTSHDLKVEAEITLNGGERCVGVVCRSGVSEWCGGAVCRSGVVVALVGQRFKTGSE